jgi:hypothetical protein
MGYILGDFFTNVSGHPVPDLRYAGWPDTYICVLQLRYSLRLRMYTQGTNCARSQSYLGTNFSMSVEFSVCMHELFRRLKNLFKNFS